MPVPDQEEDSKSTSESSGSSSSTSSNGRSATDGDQDQSHRISSQKSTVAIRETDDNPNISVVQTSQISIDSIPSSDTGIYKIHNTRGKVSKHDSIPKADTFIYMTIPPDGGYAWLVFVTAFVSQVIVDGILLSIGILLPDIAHDLSLSFKETAIVVSTQIAPLSGAFINKFGFRIVAVSGACLASLSVLAATFSEEIWMLIFFFGIISGFAMGMIWMSTSLIINYYFERYRAIVVGFTSSGSGVGVIIISFMNRSLVTKIGWRNTARLHALLLLVVTFLTLSYREVKPTKVGHVIEYVSDDDTEDSGHSIELGFDRYSMYVMPIAELTKTNSSYDTTSRNIEQRMTRMPNTEFADTRKTFRQRICPCCFRLRLSTISTDTKRYVIRHDPLDRDDIFYEGTPNYVRNGTVDVNELKEIEILPGKEEKAKSISYSLSVIRYPVQPAPSRGKCSYLPAKIRYAMSVLFDFQLLRLPKFRLMLIEALFFPMGFNIPYVYAYARAEILEDYKNLIHVIIGLTNIAFRICIGLLAYKIKFHTAYLSGSGMVLGGIITLLSGFYGANSVVFQLAYAFCFGMSVASFAALRGIVYVEVLGLEKLTNAFALTTMVMGIGVFIGTNVAGTLNDFNGGYWTAFIFAGVCMTIGGCLKLYVPKYSKDQTAIELKKASKKVRFTEIQIQK